MTGRIAAAVLFCAAFAAFRADAGWLDSRWRYRAAVRIDDRDLVRVETAVTVSFPVKGAMAADGADVRVADAEARLFPVSVDRPAGPGATATVSFAPGAADRYYIYYGNPAAPAEKQARLTSAGTVILDDYMHPAARTSGTWTWTTSTVLSGDFAHTDAPQATAFHSGSFPKSVKYRTSETLVQYVHLDPKFPPEEIMVELWTGRERLFFSWGTPKLQWRNLKKTEMGPLPEPGGWRRLEIPLSELKRDGELTGMGFYHAGGTAVWDRTSLGRANCTARVVGWEEYGVPVSAFFTAGTAGPLKKGDRVFSAVRLDASPSTGAAVFEWTVAGVRREGRSVTVVTAEKERLPVSLTVFDGERRRKDSMEYDVALPGGTAGDLKVQLRNIPHPCLRYPGETVTPGYILSNLTPVPLPLTLRFPDGERETTVLPGAVHNASVSLPLPAGDAPGAGTLEVLLGTERLASRTVRTVSIEAPGTIAADGPFLVNAERETVVALVPDYVSTPPAALRDGATILLAGGAPPELGPLLEKAFAAAGRRVTTVLLPFPTGDDHPSLANLATVLSAGKKADCVLLFPAPEPLWRHVSPAEWRRSMDAILRTVERTCGPAVLCTPFPSVPYRSAFQPYVEETVSIAAKRSAAILNLAEIYGRGTERFFLRSPGVYGNIPSAEGLALLRDAVVSLLSAR